jgi:hypothetical protein
MLLPCKILRKSQKNPKIAKLVLLETRFQTLQPLLVKFSLIQNTFASILNLRLKGYLVHNIYILALLLINFNI